MSWLGKTVLIAASFGLFSWYLSQIGLVDLREVILKLGLSALLIPAPFFVVYLVDCLAWRQTLPRNAPGFPTLLRIRWAGESVNNVIPSAYIGGEAVKVWLLKRQGVEAKIGITSVVVSKTAQTIAQAGFVLCGSLALLGIARSQPGIAYGIAFVLLGALAAVAALCWVQKAGLVKVSRSLSQLVPVLRRWLEQRREKF